jgi:Peptidase family M28
MQAAASDNAAFCYISGMVPFKRVSTWLFLAILLICWLVIRLDTTPATVGEHPADTAFIVSKAFTHLQNIAREPHSLGTSANDSVRNYILSACRSLSLDVTQLRFEVSIPESKGIVAASGINIAATLPGASIPAPSHASGRRKKILVMGHYDSESNSLGAGDDGSACAAMLECARALRAGAPLPADVLFLFTNGEENGLLGAEAFSKDSAELQDIGLILNFDGRGDKGKCLMFRTSGDNRWVIDEYARARVHHGSGSLFSELFKLLPNNTDFSTLVKTRIPGLDYAFAEGFTAYHNGTDNVANIDKNLMQEQGDNMLGSIRHFARVDLDNPHSGPDRSHSAGDGSATWFNPVGDLLLHYPPAVNLILILLTNALVLFALIFGIYKKQIRLVHAALGVVIFLLTLVFLYFIASWSLHAIRAVWPLYLGYYPNAYNSYYFYLALAAESVIVFTLIYSWPLRRWSMPSLFIAILIVLTFLLDFFYRYIPAGVYFLYFPLLGSAAVFPFLKKSPVILLIGALPAILLLAPLSYSLAELFDVQPDAALVAPLTGILLGLLVPLLSLTIRETRWLIPGTGLVVLLVGGGLGVLHGAYNPQKPYKTDLRYVVRPDEHQAWWASRNTQPDRWNKSFFAHASVKPSTYWFPVAVAQPGNELVNPAPYLDLPAPSLVLTRDSLTGRCRHLFLHCQPAPGTTTIHMSFSPDHPADSMYIAGTSYIGPLGWFDYDAPPDSGFNLIITCQPGAPFTIDLTGRSMGLPAAAGFHGYPADVIPAPASFANTTMAQRSYTYSSSNPH